MLDLGNQWAATWEALSWGLNDRTEFTLACCREQPVVFKDGNRAIAGVGSDVVWVRCGAPGRHYGADERWTPERLGVGEQGLLMQRPWGCRAPRTAGRLPVLVPPAGGPRG